MQFTYSEDCTAVAFYGISAGEDAFAGFYECATKWFQRLGYPPDKMAIGSHERTAKWKPFLRSDAKLRQTGFIGVTNIEIVSLVPKARIPLEDYLLEAGLFSKQLCATIVSRSQIAPLSREKMLPFVKFIVKTLKPAYGIGYTRPHRLGPGTYAIGICQGFGPKGWGVPGQISDEEEAEMEKISRWGHTGMPAKIWQRGLLRDVYPWNFLSGPHLKRSVGVVTLEQWIMEDVQRGHLEHLNDRLWFWEVPAINLEAIRKALQAEDIIFDWTKHLNS